MDHGSVWVRACLCVRVFGKRRSGEAACLSVSTPQSIKPNMKGIRRVIFLTWIPSVRWHAAHCAVSFFKSIQIFLSTNSASMWRRRLVMAPPKYFAPFSSSHRANKSTISNYICTLSEHARSRYRHFPVSFFIYFIFFFRNEGTSSPISIIWIWWMAN